MRAATSPFGARLASRANPKIRVASLLRKRRCQAASLPTSEAGRGFNSVHAMVIAARGRRDSFERGGRIGLRRVANSSACKTCVR